MTEGRRVARVRVSLELVRQVLCLPDNVHLHAIEGNFSDALVSRICYLVVESPELPPVPEGARVPDIDAVIHQGDDGQRTWRFVL